MDFEKLTDRARRVPAGRVDDRGTRTYHQRITPAHLLKALLDTSRGMAAGLIQAAGGEAQAARRTGSAPDVRTRPPALMARP